MVKKFKENIALVKQQVSVAEYILWWVVRICMLILAIRQIRESNQIVEKVLPFVNGSATFMIFIARMIFPRKSMLGRISYYSQKYITAMVFFGSFIGNYFHMYRMSNPIHYDWIIHAIMGVTMTLLGYHLLVSVNNSETKLTATVSALSSMGFSYFVTIVWEFIEFFGDFIFDDNNQKYNWVLKETDHFYFLLSLGKAGAKQYPVFDTMIDMLLAFVTTAITAAILYFVLKKRSRNQIIINNA